jgi:ribonuclease R
VTRVLGKAGQHQVEMHAILAEFGLPLEFPESVLQASADIPNGCNTGRDRSPPRCPQHPHAHHRPGRRERTSTMRLSVRKLENGHWEIGVHIADVSHYVRPGSVLDMEAAQRATSVYLVDRVVPMLPEKLSNDLCSCMLIHDKLSFSAIFELDEQARIKERVVRPHGDALAAPLRLCRSPSHHRWGRWPLQGTRCSCCIDLPKCCARNAWPTVRWRSAATR